MTTATQQTVSRPNPDVMAALAQGDASLWASMLARVNQDPVVARAMLDLFEARPELMKSRAAAFVAARVTVQRDRIRYAKAYRHGQRVAAVSRLGLRIASAMLRLTWTGAKALFKLMASGTARAYSSRKPVQPAALEPRLQSDRFAARPARATEKADDSTFPVIDWTALDAFAASNEPSMAKAA